MLVARGRISFLLVRGRGRRLLLHTSFRTRARIEHERRDCPRNRDPKTLGQCSPSWPYDRRVYSSFLHTLIRVRGTSFRFGVLYKHSQQHRLAKGAKVWVKVRDRSRLSNRSVADIRVVHILVAMSGLTWMS